jgi:teichuronic acid biosynthesis glycosyltransferase TuaG
MQPLVSIVMPAYNAELMIGPAIDSVLRQDYPDWELLVVDDGSNDGTVAVIKSFGDPRIRLFQQAVNGGIGKARNRGLDAATGEMLCTLDADDLMPRTSLSSRVKALLDAPEASIVDGRVLYKDAAMVNTLREYSPRFSGYPLDELLALTGNCFMGCSWMIRWSRGNRLRFNTEVSHGEDLLFYMEYAKGKRYIAVEDEVLHYRITGKSTMANLPGLESSYRYIARWLQEHPEVATAEQAARYVRAWRRIMFRTWIKQGSYWRALRALVA